jgi:bifunctional UDP-N-acetylglucosamine pyrophosphorylase / glucosamine-1-phosphate N-acetyltransferase
MNILATMRDQLSPARYFDLTTFAHAELFESCVYVWQALDQIGPYLVSSSLGNIQGDVSERAYLIDPHLISIGEGTTVEPGAYIKGPCIIGNDCTIRHGAYIRGNTITGDNCVIGHDTETKNAILLNGAKAAHFAYVGDSILGANTNLGAGVKCANLRFDGGPITIHIEGQSIETGRRKLGLILGDGAQIGCNAVPGPGTLMGKDSCAIPCLSFNGFIQEGHRAS